MKYTRKLLENMHEINALRYEKADTGASSLYVDLEDAINRAELTEMEDIVISLRYFVGLNCLEVGEVIGRHGSNVGRIEKKAIEKIAKQLGDV